VTAGHLLCNIKCKGSAFSLYHRWGPRQCTHMYRSCSSWPSVQQDHRTTMDSSWTCDPGYKEDTTRKGRLRKRGVKAYILNRHRYHLSYRYDREWTKDTPARISHFWPRSCKSQYPRPEAPISPGLCGINTGVGFQTMQAAGCVNQCVRTPPAHCLQLTSRSSKLTPCQWAVVAQRSHRYEQHLRLGCLRHS
jgi:hypothetical protein